MVDRSGESDRGQAITFEAVTAAILLVAAVGFALEMTAVTPLSASTSSQHLENQVQLTGEGVLASTAQSGELKTAALYWNRTEQSFHGAPREEYYQTVSDAPNEFMHALERSFGDRNIAYNVVVHYQSDEGIETQRVVNQGQPSDHAVSASRTVVVLEDDQLVDDNSQPTGVTVSETDSFYAPNVDFANADSNAVYNLLRVEVIAWRI